MPKAKTASMSTQELEKFSLKLQDWSSDLSDNERALFKFMLEQSWNRTTDPFDFKRVFSAPFEIQQKAPRLTADYFKVMCW